MSQDYIALEWVKGEIEDTLKQAQQALESYVDNPDDKSNLKFCLSYLHQIHGTLIMVEFYGAALLAEEMEAVALALTEQSVSQERPALEVLMQAIIQLPHYLEHVKVGRRDLPVVLLPILNELRSARGETFLSETALFAPDIVHNAPLNEGQSQNISTPAFTQWARKVRQILQAAILQLIQNKQPEVAKQYLNKAFSRLEKSLGSTPQGIVWLPALAFSEWLNHQEHLPNSAHQLLRQLDALLKDAIDEGIEAINRPASDELIKNLLFYVARTQAKGEAISRVQEQFKLQHALPDEQEVLEQREQLAGPDKGTISSVIVALMDEIALLKDSFELLVRNNSDRTEPLAEAANKIKQVADTMGMLGLGMPRRVMQEQQAAVNQLLANHNITDEALLDVAGALLYVEATLNGMQNEGNLHAHINESSLNDAQRAVLREARNVLEQVKEAIIAYIANHWAVAELHEVPELLHSLEGSVAMIPLPKVAAILSLAASFVEQQLISEGAQPEWSMMDTFADVLSGVEYYIERYSENRNDASTDLLDKAENALYSLTGSYASELTTPPIEVTLEAVELEESGEYELEVESEIETEADITIEPEIANEAIPEPELLEENDDDLIDEEIIEIFIEEAEEVVETLLEYWPQVKTNHDDQEALTTVRRAFHTLKGSGRMVKANDLGELAWSIENMFNRVLDKTISLSNDLFTLVDQVIDIIPTLIKDFNNRHKASIDTQPFMDRAFAISEGKSLEDEADETLIEIFESEARTHLEAIQEFLDESQQLEYQNSLTDNLQRALHTLKGSAHMADIESVAQIATPIEKLVKNLRAYQLGNCQELVAILTTASQIILHALNERDQLLQPTLAGSDELFAAIEILEQQITDKKETRNIQAGPSPQDIAHFMSHGMEALLDADRLLEQWKLQSDNDILQKLRHDLHLVAHDAAKANLAHIQVLAEVLDEFYESIENSPTLEIDDELIELASRAHEGLLSMLDCLAAGQETSRPEELLEELRNWDFSSEVESEELPVIEEVTELTFDGLDLPQLETFEETLEEEPEEEIVESFFEESLLEHTEEPSLEAIEEFEEIEEIEKAGSSEDLELINIFLEEAQEISESVEQSLTRWQENPEDLLQVAQLQRELHTLKGGAWMAEITAVADLCHELETLYEHISNGRLQFDVSLFDLLERAHDALSVMLDNVRTGQPALPANDIVEELKNYIKTGPTSLNKADEDIILDVEIELGTATPSFESSPVVSADTLHSEALDEDDREILEIFLEEAHELNEGLERSLQQWQQDPSQNEAPGEAQRLLHTLKGGARLSGLSKIGDIAHDFEANILQVQQGHIAINEAFFEQAYQQYDQLIEHIEKVQLTLQSGEFIALSEPTLILEPEAPSVEILEPETPEVDAFDEIDSSIELNEAPTESTNTNVVPLHSAHKKPEPVTPTPAPAQQASRVKAPQELVRVSADLLDNLVNLAGETSIGRGRLEQQVSDFSHTLEEMDMTLDRLRDQLRRLDMETEAQVLFRQERQGPEYEDFDPLEMDRYSTIQQLSRALVESTSDLVDLKETLTNKNRDAETLLLQQSRVNTELQEGLMQTRMVPFQQMVPRLRRIVRQVGQELDKKVELAIHGASGEMDRSILERMISPLEHMLRNAVDHGIETSEQRELANKPSVGQITIDISRDGGDVLLTISDDGKGVNVEAVRAKAIERGLIDANSTLDQQDILQFILQAGFSTAQTVTQISGRGVGMDVVASEIKQMGGTIEIRSQAGLGSTFIIRLPFTVSVNRALMIKMGEDLYAVPLNNIQGIVRIPANQLNELYKLPPEQRIYNYAGIDYRLDYLGSLLDNMATPDLMPQALPIPVLLVRGAHPYALQVDSLLGSREIVVKTLGPQFATVMGVSGGTILGDGSVVIILDLQAMIRIYASIEYQYARELEKAEAERRHLLEARLPQIMVVDDSVTVRKVTSRLLERNGMEVLTAKDGIDAITSLQEHIPDLILLDIEMPRMDGFEVASQIRHSSRLKHIPIIMITSRTGDKHRERAMSIGVNEYMGKPFQEDILLGTINKLLEREVD